MDEVEAGQPASPAAPASAAELLKAAREAHGLSLAEIASRTRIPLRHLEALEAGDYANLPSPTYAVGFAKAYARAAGADEVAVAQSVRKDLERIGPRTPDYVPYETADPTRVPSRGIAILGLGVALAVLILVGLWYGTDLFHGGFHSGGGTIAPADTTVATTPAATRPATAPSSVPTPPSGGRVSFVANDEVWLRVYDADNKTLFLGTMKPGDHYDVPPDAKDPMINVGRPDKLAVTLNGSAVPPLGTGERAIKDVRVSGAAIAARVAGAPAPAATPAATVATGARPERPARSPARPRLTETQRANLEAAADLRAAGNASAP